MLRFLPAIAVFVLAIVATWTLARRTAPTAAPATAPTRTAASGATPTPIADSAAAASPTAGASHRLAGTVVGDMIYAIVEAPDGSNELYGIDESVPGVGKLVAVGSKSATFEGKDGRFEMKLVAAPPPTPRPEGQSTPEPLDELFDDEEENEYYDDDGLTDDELEEDLDVAGEQRDERPPPAR